MVTGFFIKTFDDHGDLLDKSLELEIDATALLPSKIEDSDVTAELSVPAVSQFSSYSFSFDLPVPMETTGYCFVKFTFP